MANVKELMMKLIQDNPSYLTSGIPNDLLTQLIMTSNTAANTPPKPTPGPAAYTLLRPPIHRTYGPSHNQQNQQQGGGHKDYTNQSDMMKVKPQPIANYNVRFEFPLVLIKRAL